MDLKPDNKYVLTAWRTEPEHQGGMLLDGGIHHIAGLRKVLPTPIDRIAAFSRLNRAFLKPTDTIHATVLLQDGATGFFGISFASSHPKMEIELVGEEGTVSATIGHVESLITLTKDGSKETTSVEDANQKGLFGEFDGFARAVLFGKEDKSGFPEEALADLILMESMLKSGENKGASIDISKL
jgi:predicted dehydrogenase